MYFKCYHVVCCLCWLYHSIFSYDWPFGKTANFWRDCRAKRIQQLRTQLKIGFYDVPKEHIPASAEYAEAMHKVIKAALIEIFGVESKDIPVLYGSSVTSGLSQVSTSLLADPDGKSKQTFLSFSPYKPQQR